MATKTKSARKKILVIVESPSKAKTIGKYLGPSYKVMASVGHIRDLPKSKLGIDIENDFEPEYISIRGRGRSYKRTQRGKAGFKGIPGNRPGPGRRGDLMASGLSFGY